MAEVPEQNDDDGRLDRAVTSFRAARAADPTADATQFADELPTEELRALFFRAVAAPATPSGSMVLAGRYELLRPIGSGAMGKVWCAFDTRLEAEVAVKVLTVTARDAFDVERMAAREGRLLARLSHPGIVRVLDAGKDGEWHFLVMELVAGVALDELIAALRARAAPRDAGALLDVVGDAPAGERAVVRRGEPWFVAAARVALELLRTLEAAHAVHVLHRDIKPGNVRVVGGGRPVLLDFGHGMLEGVAAGTLTDAMLGTPGYAAPEQWKGAAHVDARTDVYQCGVLLYELLTLQRCFPDAGTAQLLRMVAEGEFRRPRAVDPSIPAALEACVLRAMDREPSRRYPTAAAFGADLERFLDGDRPGAAAPLAVAVGALRRGAHRHRRPLLLAAAALVGGTAAFLATRSSRPEFSFARPDEVRYEAREPLRVMAFRVATDDRGDVRCAPLRLRVAGGEPALSLDLPAGATDLQLEDVGDPALHADSTVQFWFARPSDAAASVARLAVEQASAKVRRDEGEWLSAAEVTGYLGSGRGAGDGVDVRGADAFGLGAWSAGGLSGVGLTPPD